MKLSQHARQQPPTEKDARSLRITLPLPPNRANARGHWRVIQRERKAYEAAAGTRLCEQVPAGRRYALCDVPVRVTAAFYVWARMDQDNLVSRLKWPLDVLVKWGVLRSDAAEWFALSGIPSQAIDRKHQRVELLIEAQA